MDTSDFSQAKDLLRRQCRRCRAALSAAHCAAAGQAVGARLARLAEFQRAATIHTYVASVPNELETRPLIRACLDQGKRIVVPVVDPHSRTLRHAYIASLEELTPQRWGLLEPSGEGVHWLRDLSSLELLLVPGLAFDRQGNRLGLGGGYYDRFLARVRVPRIGLTYDELLLDQVPTGTHDQAMDIVVTPTTVLRFGDV